MSGGGGFGTISDIKKDKDEEDDQDKTNTYYTGGHDDRGGGSGLAVIAPKNKDDKDDIYSKLVANAKRDAKEQPLQSGENTVEVVLYRNGFTVDGGPLRERGIPANDRFLDTLSEGICPQELFRNGEPQNVSLKDKSKEDYTPPQYIAFSGEGNTLGSTRAAVDPENVIDVTGEAETPTVNEKDKTIRVQIRYQDASKQVAKFNLHHTVHDLISVIKTSGNVAQPFILQNMKKQVITRPEFDKSLTEAGIANSVVQVLTKF